MKYTSGVKLVGFFIPMSKHNINMHTAASESEFNQENIFASFLSLMKIQVPMSFLKTESNGTIRQSKYTLKS